MPSASPESASGQVRSHCLQPINELEKDLGKTLLAYSCHDLKPSKLSPEDLSRVQAAEQKPGVSLVAVAS